VRKFEAEPVKIIDDMLIYYLQERRYGFFGRSGPVRPAPCGCENNYYRKDGEKNRV